MKSYEKRGAEQPLELVCEKPDRDTFLEWIQTKDDQEIDELLQINSRAKESSIHFENLRNADEGEELWETGAKWAPYRVINEIIEHVEFSPTESIHDLGSGYGRICIALGILLSNDISGVELVPARASTSAEAVRHLGLSNVHIKSGNIRNYELSGDSTFILFNPFATTTLNYVLEQMTVLGRHHSVRVITIGDNITYRYLKKRENFDQVQCHEANDKVVWAEFRLVR